MHRRAGSAEEKWRPSRKITVRLQLRVSKGLYKMFYFIYHPALYNSLCMVYVCVYGYVHFLWAGTRVSVFIGARGQLASSFSYGEYSSTKLTNWLVLLANKPQTHLSPAQSTAITGTCPQVQF